MDDQPILTRVPVRIVRRHRSFLDGRDAVILEYVEPCAGCGVKHRHGDLASEAYEPGSRTLHCPSSHKRFRKDCEHVKGTPFCSVVHVPPSTLVELVLVSS